MQRIVVTGSSGLIGRRLCADLAADHHVVAVDRSDPKLPLDIANFESLRRTLDDSFAVIHLAATASLDAPWTDVQTNIAGTYNVFEAARLAGCRHVIFASSNHVVGGYERSGAAGPSTPLSNDAAARPDSLYAVGKIFGEALGRYYSDAFGMRIACIRIGSMNEANSPTPPQSRLPWRRDAAAQRRLRATWFSHRDLARLIRAILERDVAYAIVYGVGDNRERFWDLKPGSDAYQYFPSDGVR